MLKSRFIIIGSGWLAMYYARIAAALPERFELCAMLCRTQEKADTIHAAQTVRKNLRLFKSFAVFHSLVTSDF